MKAKRYEITPVVHNILAINKIYQDEYVNKTMVYNFAHGLSWISCQNFPRLFIKDFCVMTDYDLCVLYEHNMFFDERIFNKPFNQKGNFIRFPLWLLACLHPNDKVYVSTGLTINDTVFYYNNVEYVIDDVCQNSYKKNYDVLYKRIDKFQKWLKTDTTTEGAEYE